MTSRERMDAALRSEKPDQVPIFLRDFTLGLDVCDYTTPEVWPARTATTPTSQRAAWSRPSACWGTTASSAAFTISASTLSAAAVGSSSLSAGFPLLRDPPSPPPTTSQTQAT